MTIRDELRQIHKDRICFWCEKSVIDCDPECQCVMCVFEKEFNKWKENHKDIYDFWILKNAKFYEELFDKGMIAENQLAKRWKRYQLTVLEKTETKIHEWIEDTDYKMTTNQYGEEVLVRNSADGYKTIFPYYEFVNKDKPVTKRFHCQLCGQDIQYRFYIKHNRKKIAIGIGGNCGYAFYYSVLVGNDIRKTMNKKINQLFRKHISEISKKLKIELDKKDSTHKHVRWCEDILKRIKKHRNVQPLGPKRIVQLLQEVQKKGLIEVF